MARGLHALGRAGAGIALSSLAAGCASDQAAGAREEPAVDPGSLASTEAAASETPLIARGNEPGWNVTIGDAEIELVTGYGATRSTFPKPAPEASGDATRYVVAEADLTITVLERPCADTMSGTFYPLTVTVERPQGVLSGCGGEAASLLLGPEWVVESLDGDALIGNSRPTIVFNQEGQVAGSASCNRYLARYELTGEGLSIAGGASTMMACDPSLMEQERRFLDALDAHPALRDRVRWRSRATCR
jgi:heat shock protein HslJ